MASRGLAFPALVVTCVVACTNHDPSLGRVGPGPIPNADAATAAGAYPCAVQKVLEARCWRCHTDPPQNGAPFSLRTYGDTQKTYLFQPVWRRMIDAVSTDYMPFTALQLTPAVQPLDPDQKATLLAWLQSGTPQDGGAAGSAGTSGAAGSAGTNGAAGSAGTSGAAGGAGTSGAAGGAGTNGAAGSAGTSGAAGAGGTAGSAGAATDAGIDGGDAGSVYFPPAAAGPGEACP